LSGTLALRSRGRCIARSVSEPYAPALDVEAEIKADFSLKKAQA
jgi:hypothetical protein